MSRQTLSVSFLLRKPKTNKSETLPIYARITVSGQRAEFSTQQMILQEDWDFKTGRAAGMGNKKCKLIKID